MVGYYTFFQALVLQSKYIVKLLLLPLLLLSSHVTSQCTGAHMPACRAPARHLSCHRALLPIVSPIAPPLPLLAPPCRLSRSRVLLPVILSVALLCAAAEGVFNKRHSEATTNVGLKYRCTWCGIVSTRVRVNV